MRYTKAQFEAEYPNNDVCLDAVFEARFGDLEFCPKCGAKTKFYRVKKRKCYACMHCGYQLHPLANTIFRKSSTSLSNWFYAIYLFSVAKNGVSAKELERHLGVTYKCAWRMAKQIRLLMAQETSKFMGVIEADETFMGGRRPINRRFDNKTALLGIAEKRGRVKVKALDGKVRAGKVLPYLKENIEPLSVLHTDESGLYNQAHKTFKHRTVDHGWHTYVSPTGVHTNNIEGFWSQLKRSVNGTYHAVSPKYLQSYVDEFAFRYNHRAFAVGRVLLDKALKHGG
ncbi:IS1595 family transposase [Candidatus Saccharibacteria bacterium]|nr:IS1595 family transposase [Candidatus Saccharibacteria bacterium]